MPLLFALTVVVVVAAPVLLLIGLVASRGRHRLLRVVVIGVTWPVMECAALLALFALWIRGRTAAYEERHYALCAWFLRQVYAVGARVLGLTVEIQEPLNAAADRPVIVLSRHAGPGDSFLIVHYLLNVYGRRPRIVMKATLQLDPTLDVMFNRLPNAFITGSAAPRGEAAGEIGRLAAGLDARGAMLIFPEGGNFTPRRRIRAIRSLRRQGDHVEARRAGRMKNVLPPHVAGTLAADRGRARGRRHLRGPHRRRRTAVGRRRVARDPDDAAAARPLVAGPVRGDPGGGPGTLAVRLVGDDRRLDRGEPPRAAAARGVTPGGGTRPLVSKT